MIKRFCTIVLCFALLACSTDRQPQMSDAMRYGTPNLPSEEYSFSGFRVAMLLPLSGKAAKQGHGLKNASQIAFVDLNNQNLVVDFFDTKSTAEGAREAAIGAITRGAKVILGPLTAEEVEAVASVAESDSVPVVSFSTSMQVLRRGVYSLGILGDEQIKKIVAYAAANGRNNFAILVPDNHYGMTLAKSAYRAAKVNNAKLVKIGFYAPDTLDFAELIAKFSNYSERVKNLADAKKEFEAAAAAGNEKAKSKLKKLEQLDSLGAPDFDAVIIPESGTKLKTIASMLGYYDVFAPDVLILGSATWDNTNLSRETTLYGALYPALDKQYAAYFSGKYSQLYGEYPETLYTLAYDAMVLASALSVQEYGSINSRLLDERGFSGLNGNFRLLSDGTNRHDLRIFEVTDSMPKDVTTNVPQQARESFGFSEEVTPQIFGKDEQTVIRFLQSDN